MGQNHSLDLLIADFFKEDDLFKNDYYTLSLPTENVLCQLKFKSPSMVVCGLPYFFSVFKHLGSDIDYQKFHLEGKELNKNHLIEFELPFNVALNGERIALNLLQRASAIATQTQLFVKKASPKNIKILDTRKTLPNFRSLEKYAVHIGGGHNHRFSQLDVFMIKDNHKKFFGSLSHAYQFFKEQKSFYTPIIAEIHHLSEIDEAKKLGIRHLMLDNFSPSDIEKAILQKEAGMTYEVSGGIHYQNIDSYLIAGVDAISIGQLTYGANPVDISLKYEKIKG